MPNTRSAAKRVRQTAKRNARNRWSRGRARTFVKRAREYINEGRLEEAREAVQWACRSLDKAASKGSIHRNNAARRKSRLTRALAKAERS